MFQSISWCKKCFDFFPSSVSTFSPSLLFPPMPKEGTETISKEKRRRKRPKKNCKNKRRRVSLLGDAKNYLISCENDTARYVSFFLLAEEQSSNLIRPS